MAIALTIAAVLTWLSDWGVLFNTPTHLANEDPKLSSSANNAIRSVIGAVLCTACVAASFVLVDSFFSGLLFTLGPACIVWAANMTGVLDREPSAYVQKAAQWLPHVALGFSVLASADTEPYEVGIRAGSAFTAGTLILVLLQWRSARRLGIPLMRPIFARELLTQRFAEGLHIQTTFLSGQVSSLLLLLMAERILGANVAGVLAYARSALIGLVQVAGFFRRVEVHSVRPNLASLYGFGIFAAYPMTIVFVSGSLVVLGVSSALVVYFLAPQVAITPIFLGLAFAVPLAVWSNITYYELVLQRGGSVLPLVDAIANVVGLMSFVVFAAPLGAFALFICDALASSTRLLLFAKLAFQGRQRGE